MKFQGFVGPAYQLDSVNVDAQRCVNLYPEVIESGTGKEGNTVYLKSTPGLEKQIEVGDGPIRLIHYDTNGNIFVASKDEMYYIVYDAGAWTATKVGDLDTSSGPIKAASATIDLGVTVFVDGTNCYLYWAYMVFETLHQDFGDFASYGYQAVTGATDVMFIDGYFIYVKAFEDQFFVSDWNSFNVDALSFSTSEGNPDVILAGATKNRELWIFNEKSTEVFVNTGNADFPFERTQNGYIDKGCCARGSVATIDEKHLWLGRDKDGMGIVYLASGLVPQRVSTHAIESAIKKYADVTQATSYTYQGGGHFFYVLNFTEATWVYDLTTGLWHERAFNNGGTLERHRVNCHCFIPDFIGSEIGMHLVGDYENNKVYKFNDEYYMDDTDYITRLRAFPHISAGGKKAFCSELKIDMETGVGLDSGQGSDPQVVMQFSNDGGHTWSDESWTSAGGKIGGIGDYKKRVMWRRLGSFRDRVFRIQITDPVKVVLIGAEIEIEGGRG
jgi:hypothetical protein